MSDIVVLQTKGIAISESAGRYIVRFNRAGDLEGDLTLTWGLTGDTATEGEDYVGTFGTFVLPDGRAEILLRLPLLDDALAEDTEVFSFSIINVEGGQLLTPRTMRISILDDERPAPPPDEPPLVSEYILDTEIVAGGLQLPIKFQFAPHDPSLAFVAGKRGLIEVVDLDTGERTTFLDLSAMVNDQGDRGLMDIALHPDFPATPYLYAFAAIDPPDVAGETGYAGADGRGNRFVQLLRFEADPATGYKTAVAGSGVVLLGGNGQSLADISGGGQFDYNRPDYAGEVSSERYANPDAADRTVWVDGFKQDYIRGDSSSHYGGGLLFGPDGALYVTTGDGTSFNYADPRTLELQSLDSLSGKVLRIDPLTGEGLADNPFVADGVSLDSNRAKVFQLGLRNPYGAGFGEDGSLFLTSTGWFSFEDVHQGGAGANFGWPFYEGVVDGVLQKTPGYRDMPEAQAFYAAVERGDIVVTPPYASFGHDVGAPGYAVQAITGGDAVLESDFYGAALNGVWLFTDFAERNVFAIDIDDPERVVFLGNSGDNPFSHFTVGADGAVYVADLLGGTIRRLVLDFVQIDGAAAATLSLAVEEGAVAAVRDFAARDGNGQTLGFRIAGGADAALFTVDAATGVLRFASAAPAFLAAGDNSYAVVVEAFDPDGHIAVATVTVAVLDRPEPLFGTDRKDALDGGATADLIDARGGNDVVAAGGGDDIFVNRAGDGIDRYDGEAGQDTYSLAGTAAGGLVNLVTGVADAGTGRDRLTRVENVVGSAGDDRIRGSVDANRIEGGAGEDSLFGGGGEDLFVVRRGTGLDRVYDFSDAAGDADTLDLSDFGIADFAALMATAYRTDQGIGFHLAGGDTVILRRFAFESFDAGDVLL